MLAISLKADYLTHCLKDGAQFMHAVTGKVNILLFGHQHHHLDFSGKELSRKFRIPVILSNGKSAEKGREYALQDDGTVRRKKLAEGLLGRLIEIDDENNIPPPFTIQFDK